MHKAIPSLTRGIANRTPSKENAVATALTKHKPSRHTLPKSAHLSASTGLDVPQSSLAQAGSRASYLKARVTLLNLRTHKARQAKRKEVRPYASREVGFDRLFARSERSGREYLVCLEPLGNKRYIKGIHKPGLKRRNAHSPGVKMRCSVHLITTPTADTPGTTLLLSFDNQRYLIGNVAEGTQRAAIQRQMSMSKLNSILLTGKVNWENTGGLLGMILTLADVKSTQRVDSMKKIVPNEEPNLNIHGGRNLNHLLATARRFVFRKGLPVIVNETRESETKANKPTWSDDNIRVWAMPILPDSSSTKQRKRSHDEMTEQTPTVQDALLSDKRETAEEIEDRNDQIRRGVVAHMFDSDWRLDALSSAKLKDVKMPATIFVRNLEGKIEKYEGILPGGDESVPDIDVLVRNPWPGAAIESLPPTIPSVEAMSYIVKCHWQRGKFDAKRALELGVEKGPQFKTLTMGNSITTDNGAVVTPEMVLGPGKPGSGIAVVELPDKSYVDNLLSRKEWDTTDVMDCLRAIVWILGKGVAADERLQIFRERFKSIDHIISSPDVCSDYLALPSPAQAALKLNLIDSERFPIPAYQNEILGSGEEEESYHRARPGVVIQLEPKYEYQVKDALEYLNTAEVVKNADKEVLRLAEEARNTINNPAYQARLDELQKDMPSKDAEVITLGTGSALPSKYRNVSATMLRVPGYGSYLFDCGENTLGQLKRVFGSTLPQVLQDLKGIWISHLHADHHLGTASVIRAWHEETRKYKNMESRKLMVASDSGMLQWLTEYSEIEDYGYSRLELQSMHQGNEFRKQFDSSKMKAYGLSSIEACPVDHCHGALAVVFTFPNGFKAAYSGDCRPSSRFARLGKGATLLIHEATFDDELAGDALAKKHSTTGDALRIGREMGARRILLTHFSQRYQKFPVMDSEGNKDQVAIVAFDYMRCRLEDFAKLAEFRPALLKLYEAKEE